MAHFSVLQIQLVFIIILLYSVVKCCPPEEEIAPFCKCSVGYSGDNILTCAGLLDPEQLHSPLRAIAQHKVKLFSLTIEDSSLMYIPGEIFKDTFIEEVLIFQSKITSLSNSDVAFGGLENSLKEIRVLGENYVVQWDWQQLRNLKHLNLINIRSIDISSIHKPFPHLPELTALGITRAGISFIVDSAFRKLSKLRILNMKDNAISKLKRTMLPNPAQELMILDLSANEISNLPADFFNDMPSLSEVHLDRNKFVTLNEDPFMFALKNIRVVTLTENHFQCDCRLRWIVDAPARNTFTAFCAIPENLAGKRILFLDLKLLRC